MSVVLPVPVSSLRFKKFGAVQFPDSPYTQTEVSAALPHTKSLLAVSNRYGTLFLLSASSSASVSIRLRRQYAAPARLSGGRQARAGPAVPVP